MCIWDDCGLIIYGRVVQYWLTTSWCNINTAASKDSGSHWNHPHYGYGNATYHTVFLLHSADDGDGLRNYHHSYPEFGNCYYYAIDCDGLTAYRHIRKSGSTIITPLSSSISWGERIVCMIVIIHEMFPQAISANVAVIFWTFPIHSPGQWLLILSWLFLPVGT